MTCIRDLHKKKRDKLGWLFCAPFSCTVSKDLLYYLSYLLLFSRLRTLYGFFFFDILMKLRAHSSCRKTIQLWQWI